MSLSVTSLSENLIVVNLVFQLKLWFVKLAFLYACTEFSVNSFFCWLYNPDIDLCFYFSDAFKLLEQICSAAIVLYLACVFQDIASIWRSMTNHYDKLLHFTFATTVLAVFTIRIPHYDVSFQSYWYL